MDYGELIAEVAERADTPGLPMRAAQLTGMAEAELNKRLRVADMEATATLTTLADKSLALPTDFLQMRAVLKDDKRVREWPLGDILSGGRTGYAVRGGTLATSFPSQALEVTYYAALPGLVANGTNWLLASDPDIYVFALLKHFFLAKMAVEPAAAAGGYLTTLIDAKAAADTTARFLGTRYRIAGQTP